ncbi:MAG: AAA family ATPase [Thermomicrobiales bacterium]|nr:AAA family ATPase [Thermomicrobiales bacterium]
MIHLRRVALTLAREEADYPFTVPAVASLRERPLAFDTAVTFVVGENGTGKSALLEGIACATGAAAIAGDDPRRDPTLAPARALGDRLRLTWRTRTRRGFFLRAEDFFGFAKYVSALRADLERDLAELEATPGADSYGGRMARGTYRREIGALRHTDQTMNETSHGESFLELFQRRFEPRGLYLLDEPEAPLSPARQLALLALLAEMAGAGESQFIIATHSPLLMAFPGAAIYSLDGGAPSRIAWDELEHVRLTRDFLNDPGLFLRHLTP